LRRLVGLAVGVLVLAVTAGCGCEGSTIPPPSLSDSDLVGTWEVMYSRTDVDRLCLREGGAFMELYTDGYTDGYRYASPWQHWWLERQTDGTVRIHLQEARYYRRGIWFAEKNGWGPVLPPLYPDSTVVPAPWSLWDPFADELVSIADKLVLDVRELPSGELVLYHLLKGGDDAYALFSCRGDAFRRIATPKPGGEPCAFDEAP
jgi:hypothetical protein